MTDRQRLEDEIKLWKQRAFNQARFVDEKDKEIERLNDKLTRWKVPEDEFGYIGKCNHCRKPCLEIEQESTGLCTCCESLKKPSLTAEDIERHEKEAEAKAEKSLERGKFMMYGYWKAIAVHMRKMKREALANKSASLPAGSLAKPKKEGTA